MEEFSSSGTLQPKEEKNTSFGWTPEYIGEFRTLVGFANNKDATSIGDVPQYDFDVIESQLVEEENYVDFRDASGEIIEVGCSIGLRASSDDSFNGDFLKFLQCSFSAISLLVLMVLGILVGTIFIIWRKRK